VPGWGLKELWSLWVSPSLKVLGWGLEELWSLWGSPSPKLSPAQKEGNGGVPLGQTIQLRHSE